MGQNLGIFAHDKYQDLGLGIRSKIWELFLTHIKGIESFGAISCICRPGYVDNNLTSPSKDCIEPYEELETLRLCDENVDDFNVAKFLKTDNDVTLVIEKSDWTFKHMENPLIYPDSGWISDTNDTNNMYIQDRVNIYFITSIELIDFDTIVGGIVKRNFFRLVFRIYPGFVTQHLR